MKILALYYSQSGQLKEILHNLLKPLSDYDLDIIEVKPTKPYPFPWTSNAFFDAMPETVLEKPVELQKISFKYENYDLICLAYQPWFLSPAPPITSILKSGVLKVKMLNKPIITVIGSRNMWINSQKSINNLITQCGGYIVANIPLIDKHNNLISAATILYWMLTGKKERMLNVFPIPGVSKKDIESTQDFGYLIKKSIEKHDFKNLQEAIVNTNKINISTEILFIEKRAKKIFLVWAKIISKASENKFKRKCLITLFKFYLLCALFIISPIVIFFYKIIIHPFTFKAVLNEKKNIYHNKF